MGVVGSIPTRRRPSEISAGNRLHTTPIWLAQLQQGQHLRKGSSSGRRHGKGNWAGRRCRVEAWIFLSRPTGDSPCARNPGGLSRIRGSY